MISTESFLQLLGRVSLQASGLVLIVMGAQFVFRRWLSPRWQCALWWLVAVRLLIPFSPQSSLSIFNFLPDNSKVPNVVSQSKVGGKSVPPVAQPEVVSTSTPEYVKFSTEGSFRNEEPKHQGPASQTPQSSTIPTTVARGASSQISLSTVLLVIWLTGIVALGSQLLIATIRMHRRLSGLFPLSDPEVLERLNKCRSQMVVAKALQIFETTSVTSPALYGFLHARLLLPLGFRQKFSGEEQKFVFLHELAHVKRHDILLNWILAGLQIVHWFNPILWMAAFRFRTDRELACDALALDRAGEDHSEAYGRTILRLLQGFTRPATVPALVGILEDKRQLKHRITAIANFNPIKSGAWLAIVLLVTLSALALTDAKDTAPNSSDVVPVSLESVLAANENEFLSKDSVWGALPRGRQDFGGIEFHMDGVIQLLGKGFQIEGRQFREKVVVPISQSNTGGVTKPGSNVGSIHLIAGSAYDDVAGSKIIDVVWRYSDRSWRRTPLENGIHVRDWWRLLYEEPTHLPYPYSKVIWTGSHPSASRWGKSLRLYRITLENPLPGKELRSIEFESAMSRASLFITALTLDPLKPGQRMDDTLDLEPTDPPLPGEFKALVLDANDQPIPGANVEVRIRQNSGKSSQADFTKSYVAAANGVANVKRPEEGLDLMEVTVSKDGFGSSKITWDSRSNTPLPTTYTFNLSAAIPIGGTVTDEAGKPILRAFVSLLPMQRRGSGISVFPGQNYTTDSEGRWTSPGVPAELIQQLTVVVSHQFYIRTNISVASRPQMEFALRQLNHNVTLAMGFFALGKVVDENGNAIEGATIWAQELPTGQRQQTTSGNTGAFAFKNISSGKVAISVTARGKKPITKQLSVTKMEQITFQLSPGSVVRARVVNEEGQSLPGTRVSLDANGTRNGNYYEFQTTTDSEGRFVWDGAPEEPLKYIFGAAGYEVKRGQALPNEENIVVLRKERKVQGRVVVAGTGQPVKSFAIGIGQGNSTDLSQLLTESGYIQFSNENGEFSLVVHEERSDSIGVTAVDYADKQLTLARGVDENTQLTIELQPSASLEGVVTTNEGLPVSGVRVLIAKGPRGLGAVLVSGRLEDYSPRPTIVTTDGDGRFKLPSPPASGNVIAANSAGFATVPLEQVRASGKLVLQPYGRIEGTISVAGEPVAGVELVLTMDELGLRSDNSYRVTTDLTGKFKFEAVPPGKVMLSRLVPTGFRSWTHSHAATVTIEPGKTTTLSLGESGAVLRGNVRFETPLNPEEDFAIIATLVPPPADIPRGMTQSQIREYLDSEAGQKQMMISRPFYASVSKSGLIQLDSIPPGIYKLTVTANRSDGDTTGSSFSTDRIVARGETSVTVPTKANPTSTISIGELVLKNTEPVPER